MPDVLLQKNNEDREIDLRSYLESYLKEEIQIEARVRNLGLFSRFLEYAALESGNPVNFSNLSQEIGITRNTIYEYFQILLDCLLVDKIEPIHSIDTRKRLSKSPKFIFFDLGVQRECSNFGVRVSSKWFASAFEQFIGIELLRWIRMHGKNYQLKYWRDHNGPEVDFVIDMGRHYLPIEVKWSSKPTVHDARHLEKFIEEYSTFDKGFVICQTPRKFSITSRVTAIPWQDLHGLLNVELDGR